MSGFSAVDRADDPALFEAYLDFTARTASAMKHYIVNAHVLAGSDVVLDIGCGAGHDVELLTGAGLAGIGIDPSAALIDAARRRVAGLGPRAALIRANGEAIPLRDGRVGGCRIERVLQHVSDPALVLSEAVRCVRPGGLLTVFEPDWTTFRIPSATLGADASWLTRVKQPGIGGALWDLLERAGCQVVDRVEELSVWTSFDLADRLVSVRSGLERQVDRGHFTAKEAATWLAEQRALDAAGRFRATIAKVLVCAHKQ